MKTLWLYTIKIYVYNHPEYRKTVNKLLSRIFSLEMTCVTSEQMKYFQTKQISCTFFVFCLCFLFSSLFIYAQCSSFAFSCSLILQCFLASNNMVLCDLIQNIYQRIRASVYFWYHKFYFIHFFFVIFSVKFSRASKRKQYVLLPFVFSCFLRAFVKAFLCDNLFSFVFFFIYCKRMEASVIITLKWILFTWKIPVYWGKATSFTSTI